jgi:thymidine kinase
MSLDITLGPMFSGKTTELNRKAKRFRIISNNVLVINHSSDNRYGSASDTLSHDNCFSCPSVPTNRLESLYKNPMFTNAKYVLINEAQFFPDLYDFCKKAVDTFGKHVSVFGLDGDFQRKPFGEILKIIPLANSVTKLTALCKVCGDGTPGLFTKRTTNQCEQVLVGGAECYQAVCRRHFYA